MRPIALKRGYRTPFVKMDREYAKLDAVDLSVHLVNGMLEKREIPPEQIQHLIWGMVVPDPDIYSIARELILASRLDHRVEGYSLSRACATSLQAAANAAFYYNAFPQEPTVTLVGGVESFSSSRLTFSHEATAFFKQWRSKAPLPRKLEALLKVRPSTFRPIPPSAKEYSTGLTMGEHAELMVKDFRISRQRQDRLSLASHQHAVAARPKIAAQLIPTQGVAQDTLIRPDTSMEALSKLSPAFDRSASGTITAGNASPFTDGAAALYVISPALESVLAPDGYLADLEFVAVEPKEGLLMGPGKAMLRILERNRLRFNDIDYLEMHEAFAGQVLCNVEAVNDASYRTRVYGLNYDAGRLDEKVLNPWGSSIALGHPFGATGARMLNQAIAYLNDTQKSCALLGICAAGALAGAALVRRK